MEKLSEFLPAAVDPKSLDEWAIKRLGLKHDICRCTAETYNTFMNLTSIINDGPYIYYENQHDIIKRFYLKHYEQKIWLKDE